MQVGLIAQFMEPTPSLTAVVMACVTTQNRLFTSALTRAGLCSATRHVLTSRDPKAKQSKPTALLTGRKEAPITLWLRWTAAMSAWRIRSQASDVLFTRKHTTAFSFRSQLKQSVIYILQMKDTEQWNCQDVRIIDSLWSRTILHMSFNILINPCFSVKEDGSSCHFPTWFSAHRRYHSLSYSNAYQINQAGNALTLETTGTDATTKLECLNMKSETNTTALFTVQSVRSW